jgi:F0F1-type ATP synthase gamma subunit
LFVALTSDRGLCGAFHTNICRELEADMAASNAAEMKIVTIGDKAKQYFQSKVTILYQIINFEARSPSKYFFLR